MSYTKYYVYKEKISTDGGDTWTYTGNQTPSGDPIGTYSTLEECQSSTPPGPTGQYFTVVPRRNGSIGMHWVNHFYYSLDSGATWNYATSSTYIPATTGNKIMLKGDIIPDEAHGIGTIDLADGIFDVEGNIMSMIYGANFANQTDLSDKPRAFANFFDRGGGDPNQIVNAENLILPATTLSHECYAQMFYGCPLLETAPALPATTLEDGCYYQMFAGCGSLTTPPELPATTLAPSCYSRMFEECYALTTAPALPATTLAESCYYQMFDSCTSLTTSPVLSATTLVRRCYYNMFVGCRSLNSITCLATDISAADCTYYWTTNVPRIGTFYKNSDMSSWDRGESGIPSNWSVQNYNG